MSPFSLADLNRLDSPAGAPPPGGAGLDRVQTLRHLSGLLHSTPTQGDAPAFVALIRAAQRVLELGDRELAERFKVSRATLRRWMAGDALPHPLGRDPALRSLAELADQRLEYYGAREVVPICA